MGTLTTTREQEISKILAPWLRARVENGLLKVWLSENAPEYVKELYRCKCQYKNVGKVEYKNVGFSPYSSVT